jgi:hypothetical protein
VAVLWVKPQATKPQARADGTVLEISILGSIANLAEGVDWLEW